MRLHTIFSSSALSFFRRCSLVYTSTGCPENIDDAERRSAELRAISSSIARLESCRNPSARLRQPQQSGAVLRQSVLGPKR